MLRLAFLSVCFCAGYRLCFDIDTDMHGIDTTLRYTTIPANKGIEGAVSVRERAVNEAALCVSCAHVSCDVFVCGCVPRGTAPPLPRPPPLSLPSFSFPIRAHGGFQGLLAGRADATSALDAGLG